MNYRRMASATVHPHEITKLKELSITLLSTLREILSINEYCCKSTVPVNILSL